MRIGVDMDDVLADFNKGWIDLYNAEFDEKVAYDACVTWKVCGYTHFDTDDQWFDWLRDSHGTMFSDLEPIKGALNGVRELKYGKHEIVIITNKPKWAWSCTAAWLKQYDVPADEIHITKRKQHVAVDVLVDDGLHNLEVASSDTFKILYDQPWNRAGFKGIPHIRAWDWEDVVLYTLSNWRGFAMPTSIPKPGTRFHKNTGEKGTFTGETAKGYLSDSPSYWIKWDEGDSTHAPLEYWRDEGEFVANNSDEVRIVNETTGGEKGQKLARFDLIPAGPLRQVAEHYGKGAQKYADRNWERGYDWSLSYGALMRHANLFWDGEDIDEETGSHHMAAVIFHALALIEFGMTHPELDDRP